MPNHTKIATCSYCSTRTMLRLIGKKRHRLACASCGAPLSRMKPIPVARSSAAKPNPRAYPVNFQRKRKTQSKYRKREWSFWDELWDEIEDFFDDLEDWFD